VEKKAAFGRAVAMGRLSAEGTVTWWKVTRGNGLKEQTPGAARRRIGAAERASGDRSCEDVNALDVTAPAGYVPAGSPPSLIATRRGNRRHLSALAMVAEDGGGDRPLHVTPSTSHRSPARDMQNVLSSIESTLTAHEPHGSDPPPLRAPRPVRMWLPAGFHGAMRWATSRFHQSSLAIMKVWISASARQPVHHFFRVLGDCRWLSGQLLLPEPVG